MPLNLASPGILVREVDLTVGRIDPTSDKIGAIVGPFERGPVELPTLIQSEKDLIEIFGRPYSTDKQYETWLCASSYLAYGGALQVIRADDNGFVNAGVGGTTKIKSKEHYEQLGYDDNTINGVVVTAKTSGSWANGLRIALIDAEADQTLVGISTTSVTSFSAAISDRSGVLVGSASTIGITTTSITIGQEVKCDVSGVVSAGTTVTAVGAGVITISNSSLQTATVTTTFDFGTTTTVNASLQVGYGITQSLQGRIDPGVGTTTGLDGYLKGIITGVGASTIDVKVLGHVSAAGTEYVRDYQPSGTWAFTATGSVGITTTGQTSGYGTASYASRRDWFEQQNLVVSTSAVGTATTEVTINWATVADRPSTTSYADARGSRFDELHIVVIDGDGSVTGNAGTILEKHLGLSKAKDAEFSAGSTAYWRKYLAENSAYVYGGAQPTGVVTTGYSSGFTLATNGSWDQPAEGKLFSSIGVYNSRLSGGKDYGGATGVNTTGALSAGLSNIVNAYGILENQEQYEVDFLLMGSANLDKEPAQALANKIISVAEIRKDSVAFVSPYRKAFITDTSVGSVTVENGETITTNVISFYAPLTSSSYAIFDSGYKYMYDRFNNTFRYVPLNGDIAGICARNDINNFPWFSPAGTTRGTILNAVKLAYNPSKTQRDRLYSNRVNPVIFSPGSGIVLFGDKTGLSKASAFDRINVRRLFIFLEDAISAAAKDQLFEFNDEITRTSFVNIIEPFLRDVQSKRGISDYVVICDETNNTASVIDNNEFVAEIYIKPARSINFIGLTFVATRSGVAFEEVIGNV